MTRLGDRVVEGSQEELSQLLRKNSDELEAKAVQIWCRTEIGDACRVYPALLRCTARQLLILERSHSLPIEVAAGACRTTFETNIRARLAVADPKYLMKFQLERVADEQALIDSFISLSELREDNSARGILENRRIEINSLLDRRGLKVGRSEKIIDNAKAAGVFGEYTTLYKFYSKYVHASGWLVLASDAERESEDGRKILQIMTQVYSANTHYIISQSFDTLCAVIKERFKI